MRRGTVKKDRIQKNPAGEQSVTRPKLRCCQLAFAPSVRLTADERRE